MNKTSPTESQQAKIIEHLKKGYSITPMIALEKFNCFRLGARIKNLRYKGNEIVTEMVDDKKSGKRYASYRLAGVEPKKERSLKGKSVVDFARAIHQVKQSPLSVEKLF